MKEQDLYIIQELKSNPERGMALLYDNYASALYGIIYRICKNETNAQDALQDSFIKIWKGIDSYDSNKAQLFTWMYTIARRTAIDQYRKVKKQNTIDIQEVNFDVSQSVNSPIDTIDIKDKMAALDIKYKDVLLGLFFEGYSQREWSKKTGLPLGTIKTRLRIAMRELRKSYLQMVVSIITLIIIVL